MRTYDLEEALLKSHDRRTVYFIGRFDDYLVVVSNNISIWQKKDEGYMLTQRVFWDYTFCDRAKNYRDGDDVKPFVMLYPIRDEEHGLYANLFDIQYTKTYDVDIPENITKFDKEFTGLLDKFDELSVLNEEFDLKYEDLRLLFFNFIWDNDIPLKEVLKYAKKIRRIYIREVKRHNDLPEENHSHGFH